MTSEYAVLYVFIFWLFSPIPCQCRHSAWRPVQLKKQGPGRQNLKIVSSLHKTLGAAALAGMGALLCGVNPCCINTLGGRNSHHQQASGWLL